MISQSPRRERDGARSWFRYARIGLIACIALEIVVLGCMLFGPAKNQDKQAVKPAAIVKDPNVPEVNTDILFSNRNKILDIAFLPSGEMLFAEQSGMVQIVRGGQVEQLASIPVAYIGEGGLMGMTVDPSFADNRYVYTCANTGYKDIRVTRWALPSSLEALTQKTDIITGIPSSPAGRHSGCRMAFGPDGYLWVGTGDGAVSSAPQDPKSLGGKILRVDRNGAAAYGNLARPFDSRIYSYGHRNVQGIAFFREPLYGMIGVSSEQGPDVDDEVNPLSQGNFGWAPPAGPYTESSPMTDTARYPDAIAAVWRTGRPTQTPSAITILNGKQWKTWEGAIAMAVVNDKHLKILELGKEYDDNKVTRLLQAGFGKIRSVVQGPDGNLYIGTSNGVDDKIIKVSPR